MWWLRRLFAVVEACLRAVREVRGRLTAVVRARRLARGLTAIADREVVTVEGTVRATATALTAPLSGRSCVAYHAIATLYRGEGSERIPVGMFEERRLTPFDLEITRTGETVTIDGDQAELAEPPAPLIPRKLELEQRFVERCDRPAELARHSGFVEAVIAIGDRVRVQGLALVEAHSATEHLYRDSVRRTRIITHPAHPLTIGRR